MKTTYRYVAAQCSKIMTQAYTNSFSLSIKCLPKKYQPPIYAIYGFFRLGDEIVDAFHDYPQKKLLTAFKKDTYTAIEHKISLNPILYNFQQVVHTYQIDHTLIQAFFDSMEMDLNQSTHTQVSFEKYIFGVAEVVGLMCLKIFCKNDITKYLKLKPYAMKLGATLQKVNFLRDIGEDYYQLKRIYFPHINFEAFDDVAKQKIEAEIKADFKEALNGIKMLPKQLRFGIYLAYRYYKKIFEKINKTPVQKIVNQRIRIPSYQKYAMIIYAGIKSKLNIL